MTRKNLCKSIGPGPIIAAAFIGPGTVTVCTLAGVNFGTSLLWAMVISILITGVLQESSGRIGIVSRKDLSELLRSDVLPSQLRWFAIPLVFTAIGLGNAAYESGNLTGAALGLDVFFHFPNWQLGALSLDPLNLLISLVVLILLWFGSYQTLQKILVGLVLVLSFSFILTAILTKPSFLEVLKGFLPSATEQNWLTVAALLGTTVVPYNLFLYANLAKSKWLNSSEIPAMRKDIWVSVILGGIVSMGIILVGASNPSEEINSALDVSRGLESIFGPAAKLLMGLGLFGAGITSAITAPLATGLVICGLMNWSQKVDSPPMRWTMLSIVILGMIFSSLGFRPVQLIVLAQLANGILLPLISGWILWIASQKAILGKHQTTRKAQVLGFLIWLLTLVLGIKSLALVLSPG
ncbi:Nramp family divalent metal transporter [Algoriphagus namhaensis]